MMRADGCECARATHIARTHARTHAHTHTHTHTHKHTHAQMHTRTLSISYLKLNVTLSDSSECQRLNTCASKGWLSKVDPIRVKSILKNRRYQDFWKRKKKAVSVKWVEEEKPWHFAYHMQIFSKCVCVCTWHSLKKKNHTWHFLLSYCGKKKEMKVRTWFFGGIGDRSVNHFRSCAVPNSSKWKAICFSIARKLMQEQKQKVKHQIKWKS